MSENNVHFGARTPVRTVFRLLRALPYADEIEVFGSTARGKAAPGDIDTMMTFKDRDAFFRHPAYAMLLAIARRYYGSYDPFVRVGKALWMRSDNADGWIPAKKAREIYANYKRERISLPSVHLTACNTEKVDQ